MLSAIYFQRVHTKNMCVCARIWGFPDGICSAGDAHSIPGLGRSLGQEMATHSSILAWKNPTDRGAWRPTIHRVAKESDTTEPLSTHMQVCIQREKQKQNTHTQQMCQNIYHWWIELESIVYGCSFYYPFFYKFELFQIKKLGKNRH